eukprot:CAMPEP_0181335818 /NCGR_PEP_ID=MMETSP1101-20121128/27051_1 /TAXON_ID=46948 /ORGANISM="Rhodomonas abbreviata, Strain Caron Lab Isolate" /LENGTH=481 /DNA_ID=CAMNT_0023445997 /DNA_START=60 /DNA_END=1505 /DNA_ORIENTATION=+
MRAFALFVGLLAAIANAAIPTEEGVLVLGEDNFEEAKTTHPSMLVEFYAPWCGHCKTLAPEWASAAKTLADSPMKLAKVDATENDALAKEFEIRGFPTIKYLKNGKASDYNGGRTASEIVNWVNKKAGPAAVTITTAEDLAGLQEKHDVFALGVFASVDSDAAKAFLSMADADEINTYAITSAAAVSKQLAVTGDAVVVIKNFDDLRADLALAAGAEFDAEAVQEFVSANSTPLVQEFTPESAKKIFGSAIQQHVLFFTKKGSDHHEPTMAAYTAAAAAFKGKLLFINVPASEQKILDYFGITKADVPTAVLADLGNEGGIKKFPYSGEHNSADISAFAQKFLDGELKPTLKSEEVEAEDTAGDVVVLKGTSFSELVLDNTKDVLVKFYAPWCGHCKKLAPVWDDLGEKMASSENVVIAKMDSTANEVDVPGLSVKGFPTLYFFKGDDKANPVKYEEGRELDDFVAFLKKNAHNTVNHEEL